MKKQSTATQAIRSKAKHSTAAAKRSTETARADSAAYCFAFCFALLCCSVPYYALLCYAIPVGACNVMSYLVDFSLTDGRHKRRRTIATNGPDEFSNFFWIKHGWFQEQWRSFIHSFIHRSIHPDINPSIHPFTPPFIQTYIRLHTYTHPSTHTPPAQLQTPPFYSPCQ